MTLCNYVATIADIFVRLAVTLLLKFRIKTSGSIEIRTYDLPLCMQMLKTTELVNPVVDRAVAKLHLAVKFPS